MAEAVPDNFADVNQLIFDIKQGTIENSFQKVLKAHELLKCLVSDGNWKTAHELMEAIRSRMKILRENLPHEAVPVNILRHFLKIIREEYENASKRKGEDQSLHQLATGNADGALDYSHYLPNLKNALLDHLAEYKIELESTPDNIANQATEHIHPNEIILTVGKSNNVERFLLSVAKERSFQVILAESNQVEKGHLMASNLAKANIQTTVIPDSNVFAMMSRVNKVIIGIHTILADGGLRALSGVHAVALAAKHYSVPVLVLAPIYKLASFYYGNAPKDFHLLGSTEHMLPEGMDDVRLINPTFDYVPPELVTLFITHQGANAPSYVYRMLSETYHPEDHNN